MLSSCIYVYGFRLIGILNAKFAVQKGATYFNRAVAGYRISNRVSIDSNIADMLIVDASEVQPWTGPEGSRKSRIPDFKTIYTRRR